MKKEDPYRKLKEKYYNKGLRNYPNYWTPHPDEISELSAGKLNYETILRIYRVAWKKRESAVKENPFPCCTWVDIVLKK